MIVVSLRAVCRALDKRTRPVVGPRPRAAGAAVRPGAPDLPARAGQHHPGPHGRGRPDDGPAAAPGDPGRAGGRHQGDAHHPDPVPLPHPAGPGRRAGPSPPSCAAALLAAAVNASTSWSYWTHYIRDPQRAGMLSWIGNQGVLGATERMLGHTVTTPTTFVIVVTVGVVGLLIAAGAYRRSSPVLGLARGGGHRVAGQPGLVVAPLHLDGPAGGLAGAGRGPAPRRRVVRARRRRAAVGCAVLVGAARAGACASPGGAGSLPLGDADVLVFIVLLVGAAVRVVRSTWSGPLRLGRHGRAMAPIGRRHLTPGRPTAGRRQPRGPDRARRRG